MSLQMLIVGTSLAWNQMRIIVVKLLWHFDIRNCEENREWMDQNVYITWDKKPLAATISLRSR